MTEASSAQPLEPTYQLNNYVVCVLDLLAQKEKLKSWSILPKDGKLTEPFQAGLKQTIGSVLFFYESFTKFFEAQQADTRFTAINLGLMSSGEQQRYRRQKDFQLGVAQFSDTFVFYAPLVNAEHELLVWPLYAILGACAMAMSISLAAECPLRGGIDIGPGLKLPGLSFYGPALATAHCLEDEIAQYPRIVVSPSVADFVQHTPALIGCRLMDRWMPEMLTKSRNMLCHDFDGRVIVDWLGSGWRGISGDHHLTPEMSQALRQAYDFAGQMANDFERRSKSADDPDERKRAMELAERYLHLYTYMVRRLPDWGVTFIDGE